MITPTTRTRLLIGLAILNVVVIAIMQSFGPSLKPFSIIGFEFASTPEHARLMITTWQEKGVLDFVYFLIGFDYLFMITYSAFLWLACRAVADRLSGSMQTVITIMAWLQPLAAVLDAIENFALYRMAAGSGNAVWPTISIICAIPKFTIVLLAVVACLSGLAYASARKK
jgi:hypothetical protein